ncbi:MAG: flagellar hook-length control protein FliK, partial [Acidimicrobiales bacterium]
ISAPPLTPPLASSPAPVAAHNGPVAPREAMPGVAGQLVSVLSPPRPTANGTYTVTVSLHPESLGEVQATVTAGHDQVSVRLVAINPTGAAAIQQALPQLQEALSTAGQRTSITLAGPPNGGAGQQGSPAGSNGGGASSHLDTTWRPARDTQPVTRHEPRVATAPPTTTARRVHRAGVAQLVDIRV